MGDKLEDLENRSRRNNLRLVGLPETVVMKDLQALCEKDLSQALVTTVKSSEHIELASKPCTAHRPRMATESRPDKLSCVFWTLMIKLTS